MGSVADFEVVDAKTFKMKHEGAVRPGAAVARQAVVERALHDAEEDVAETDPTQQIKVEDVIGSGPFIFKADEWKPGEKIVYVKNPKYKPRAEPASGLAGGKVVKLDRVEWIAHARRADPGRRAAERRDRHDRIAGARPAAAAGQGQEHQAGRTPIRSATSTPSASTALPSRSTIAKIRHAVFVRLRPGGLPQGHDRRSAVLQGLQGDVRLRHAAGQRRRHGRRAERQRRQGQGSC